MTDIPTYPLDDPNFKRGLLIQQAQDQNIPLLQNPNDAPALDFGTKMTEMRDVIRQTLPCVKAQTGIDALNQLDDAAVGLTAAGTGVLDHTNTLLFGDDNDSIISGGLPANIAQVQSANTLFNTLAGLAGIAASCDLFKEFFCSLFGGAAELYGRGIDAANRAIATANNLMSAVVDNINVVINGVVATIADLVNRLNAVIAEVAALANEMIDLVTREIQAFFDWLQRQIDLGFGNFLSALKDIPCIGDLLSNVQTPQLDAILNTPDAQLDPIFAGSAEAGEVTGVTIPELANPGLC